MDPVLTLELPPRAEYIAIGRLVVSSLVSARREMSDERVDDLKLAVSEACTNAIDAHLAAGVARPVQITVAEDDERLEVTVADAGEGIDDGTLASGPLSDPDRLTFERGLGIPLIRSLVDEATFDTSPGGTRVRLTVYGAPVEFQPSAASATDR